MLKKIFFSSAKLRKVLSLNNVEESSTAEYFKKIHTAQKWFGTKRLKLSKNPLKFNYELQRFNKFM